MANTPRKDRRPSSRGLGDRMGLQRAGQAPPARSTKRTIPPEHRAERGKSGAPMSPPQGRSTAAPRPEPRSAPARRPGERPHTTPRPARTGAERPPQPNPQRAGYQNVRAARRETQAQRLRQRRRRALLGFLLVMALLIVGIALSINLLFKVREFRVENTDGTVPAQTGIYSEEQILQLLAVQTGDNLFGFSTAEKSRQLAAQLPYLDEVKVGVSLPGTVFVQVRPATERFAIQTMSGWLVLSDGLKVLRTAEGQPEGSIWLEANLPPELPTLPGQYLTVTNGSLPLEDGTAATPDPNAPAAADVLDQLITALDRSGLLEGVTRLTMTDLNELSFWYQNRVQVLLGTPNNLADKMQYARAALLDVGGEGLGTNDRGTLDISYQRSDGRIWAYFDPYTEPTPTPAPPPEEEGGADGDLAASPTAGTN